MANSKDNLRAYGKSFIGFDEPSGNAIDTIGGWTGTLYNNPTRVAGWNGEGYAMSFNGTNQYVQFNNRIIPNNSTFSIRFKFKKASLPSSWGNIMATTDFSASSNGFHIGVNRNGFCNFATRVTGVAQSDVITSKNICDGKWHDVCIIFDTTDKVSSIYIDGILEASSPFLTQSNVTSNMNLFIGKSGGADYLACEIDAIEVYYQPISIIPDKYLVVHNSQYKYHNGAAWQTTTATEANFKQYGMSQLSQITEAQWEELTGDIGISMWSDFQPKEYLEANIQVKPFSVYDYIGELPVAIAYTESTEDIIVSTTTEPFDIYDEFGDTVDVLYHTDDETVTNADLNLEANWSPVDELDGDFEVATWTDEEDAHKILEMTALPVPQFTYDSDGLIPLEEFISSVKATDLSIYDDSSMARFLMSNNNSDWYTWNGSSFVKIANMTNDEIILNGMTAEIFNGLTPQDLTKWIFKAVNIGVFLYDDIRERVQSKVSELSIDTQIPSNTSKVEDVNLYILNTTAKINIDLSGLSLTGQVVDDDMTRVQYRVSLNGKPYFPADGNFTALSNPPLNIDITIKSDEVKVGDWNTIEVEFQDYFGTTDTWSAQFIGKYAGIMFSDPEGNYYSTDVGKVLKYLEFGEILTGQVTPYYEVKLKNEYGFDVRDTTLTVNTQNFPKGLTVELSDSSRDIGDAELQVGDLANDEEFTFYVRMKSTADTVPNDNSKFDIVVLAIRDV